MSAVPECCAAAGSRCGTTTSYTHDRCRCQACRDAQYQSHRAWQDRVKPSDAPTHGTRWVYVNYRCRCGPCRKANVTYEAERRRRKAGAA